MKQKTWTDLLGPFAAADHAVEGRYIVRRESNGTGRFNKWAFDSEAQARRAFEAWREERPTVVCAKHIGPIIRPCEQCGHEWLAHSWGVGRTDNEAR